MDTSLPSHLRCAVDTGHLQACAVHRDFICLETIQDVTPLVSLCSHGNLNGDGFGIGWFSAEGATPRTDPTPCTFTSITPAWCNTFSGRHHSELRPWRKHSRQQRTSCMPACVESAANGGDTTSLNAGTMRTWGVSHARSYHRWCLPTCGLRIQVSSGSVLVQAWHCFTLRVQQRTAPGRLTLRMLVPGQACPCLTRTAIHSRCNSPLPIVHCIFPIPIL